MLYKDIKSHDENAFQVKHNDIIIWEKPSRQFIINNNNFKNYFTTFIGTYSPITIQSNRKIVSTNEFELMSMKQIKDISFTSSSLSDFLMLVTFCCRDINYFKSFNVYLDKYSISQTLNGEDRLMLINTINLNLNHNWSIYFSHDKDRGSSERNFNIWNICDATLRIDYYYY